MPESEMKTFAEFWPFYVREHSNATSRALHFVGTTLVLGCVGAAIVNGRPSLLVAAPLFGYGFAWVGHFFFQRNRPATFTYPLWSLRGDFEMVRYMLAGRDAELTVLARDYLRDNEFARTDANYPKVEELAAV